jgi:hypothetical protein
MDTFYRKNRVEINQCAERAAMRGSHSCGAPGDHDAGESTRRMSIVLRGVLPIAQSDYVGVPEQGRVELPGLPDTRKLSFTAANKGGGI